jgi:hypothetical protein
MTNYQILNHLGEVVNPSVSRPELDLMIESNEFNVFEWSYVEDADIIVGFSNQLTETPDLNLSNVRIYKLIEE